MLSSPHNLITKNNYQGVCMPQLTRESVKKLLEDLHEAITRFITSYQDDRKKVRETVIKHIKTIQKKILTDIKKDLDNENLSSSITIYDGYVRRLGDLANEAIREGTGVFVDDKELMAFGKSLSTTVSTDLNNLRSEFLEELEKLERKEQQKTEQSDVQEIKQQLGNLTKELQGAVTELKTTKEALQGLGQIFQLVTIETSDDRTYNQLTSVCKTLQLPPPPVKRIESAPASKSYFPFPDLKEDKFGIEGFDPNLFADKKKLINWKEKPENLKAYEKLKLSECVYADMYAAIIELGELLGKCITNPQANFRSDPVLKSKVEAVLCNLIENWDKPWSVCKEQVFAPALKDAPSLLQTCLEKLSTFNHDNTIIHEHFYSDRKEKIIALLSIIYYKDFNEHNHFLPKHNTAKTKLESQLESRKEEVSQPTVQTLTN